MRVVGLQEFVDLDAKALLREATDMHVARRRECQARLGAAIGRKHGGVNYVAVRAEQMVGVLLLVFVRPQLAAEIKHLHVDTVKTGFGGNAGNKGGVAVRVRVGGHGGADADNNADADWLLPFSILKVCLVK